MTSVRPSPTEGTASGHRSGLCGSTRSGSAVSPTSWSIGEQDTVADLIGAYQQECERSRAAAAAHDLDHAVPHPMLGQVSLRWIYVHMVGETARHAGHADILRELTDGSTGVA